MTAHYILIVDDDRHIRRLVSDVLDDSNYVTRSAEHGRAALDIALEETPALVLLDMRMPVMDGWEFASRLRESVGPVPIVVMTAAQDAVGRASEIHARGVLAKPFDLDHLLRIVEETLGAETER